MPVQAWPVARACRMTCADPNRADRCSPTAGMICGWRRPDSRIEAVAPRRMMLALPAVLALPAAVPAILEIAMLGAATVLAQGDHQGRSQHADHPARSHQQLAS